ncbi:MAG: archaellin/type IV pilin N-terminal domain-containing protein [Candidatus Pacearchaeota archaeon]
MFQLNKKGVSELIAYVLLISIAVSLSIIVYAWLVVWVEPKPEGSTCPPGVDVVVTDYICTPKGGNNPGNFSISLKNKGRFTFDGFVLRVHDRPDAEFGLYTLKSYGNPDGEKLAPGQELINKIYSLGNLNNISYFEVVPFMEGESRVLCSDFVSLKIDCN